MDDKATSAIPPEEENTHDLVQRELREAMGENAPESPQTPRVEKTKAEKTKEPKAQKSLSKAIPSLTPIGKNRPNRVVVIGAGMAGLATAALLAKKGYSVSVFEKNNTIEGGAGLEEVAGYVFDKHPPWCFMTKVLEHFFSLLGEDFGKCVPMKRLDPSYRVFTESGHYDISSDTQSVAALFETAESGAGEKLTAYMEEAKKIYQDAWKEFLFKNHESSAGFIADKIISKGKDIVGSKKIAAAIAKLWKSEALRRIMELHSFFTLGTSPESAPDLYRFLNYSDFENGVWYPEEGMQKIPEALKEISVNHGAQYFTGSAVKRIVVSNGAVQGIELESGRTVEADIVVSTADLAHSETTLLAKEFQTYPASYWEKKIVGPSAFVMHLGLSTAIPALSYHNFVFPKMWTSYMKDIFATSKFPSTPAFYVSAPVRMNPDVAPAGKENISVFVPVPAGLSYQESDLKLYGEKIIRALADTVDFPDIKNKIEYAKTYCVKDFAADYNSIRGSLFGLSHTADQVGKMRPANMSKKVKNLYYAGANTNPGVGMAFAPISAELAYKRIEGIETPGPLERLDSSVDIL